MTMRRRVLRWATALMLPASLHAQTAPRSAAPTPASTPAFQPRPHTQRAPLYAGAGPAESAWYADAGATVERDRPARWALAEHRRLARALGTLAPQRPGVVDAYVVVAGLDSDLVFGREARETARVLSRRYDAAGRTIVLAGSDGSAESTLPRAAPDALGAALARVAEVMDPAEDVLILYTTGHGGPLGLAYADGDEGFGMISPTRLWGLLGTLDIRNRLLILSACYSGVFVPMLQSPTTIILTAASSERTSFGCQADNDWTFFGDALVNRAMRRDVPLAAAAAAAGTLVASWERQAALTPSEPQVSIGTDTTRWLAPLEARTPHGATTPVGRSSIVSLVPK